MAVPVEGAVDSMLGDVAIRDRDLSLSPPSHDGIVRDYDDRQARTVEFPKEV